METQKLFLTLSTSRWVVSITLAAVLLVLLIAPILATGNPGDLDYTFDPGEGANNHVIAVATQLDGKILIGGHFTVYNDETRNHIARLDSDGNLDYTFNPRITGDYVSAIVAQADGKILIGGYFTTCNSATRNYIARLDSKGNLDTDFLNTGEGADGPVYAIAVQSDGKIIIGGDFTTYNGKTRKRIARLNSNGSLDTTFDPGEGAGDSVFAVATQTDGKILIGGSFISYNGAPRNNIARLDSNGLLDTTTDLLNIGEGTKAAFGISSFVLAVTAQSDGKILIGGFFTSYNGVARNNIARLNGDGSLDDTFDPGKGANGASCKIVPTDGAVIAITAQPNGKILIGGDFTSYNGMTRNNIARLNGDGSLDDTFDPGAGTKRSFLEFQCNPVIAITAQPDGKILIGGSFTSYNGVARNNIARLNGSQLTLDKFVSPNSVKPGQAVTYTITFSNTWGITATNVVITDDLPISITGTNYTSSGVALTQIPGSRYVWTTPILTPNQGGVITITGVLTQPLTAEVLTNTVIISVSGKGEIYSIGGGPTMVSGATKTAEIPLTVSNVAPIANAGPDQYVDVNQIVTLDGSASTDTDGNLPLSYGWRQIGGPAVTFNPAISRTVFTMPPTATALTFILTVTDSLGRPSRPDETVITVKSFDCYLPLIVKNDAP